METVLVLLLVATIPCGGFGVSAAVAQPVPGAEDAPTPEGNQGGQEAHRVHEPSGQLEAVIPPGREALLAEMLGRGTPLPGQCKFKNGQVEHNAVKASYACPGGEVVFELCHPSKAPADASHTAQFAIVRLSGSPPTGMEDALIASIRSRETTFEWKWVGDPTQRSTPVLALLAVGALLAAMALWLILRRRQRPTGP